MEKMTIAKLVASAAILGLSVWGASGLVGGHDVTYQIPGPYTAESTNDFSTVKVDMTIKGETITDCAITSSGDNDLMTDAIRDEWAKAIVEAQSADTDVITGASLKFSANSVRECVDDILVQAGMKDASEIEKPEATEAPAEAEASATEAPVESVKAEPEAGAPAQSADKAETGNAMKYMRPRPAFAASDSTGEAVAEAETDSAMKYMRPRPAFAASIEESTEAPVEEVPAESGDATKYMRPRPAFAASIEESTEAPVEEAPAESGDATKYMRPRPAFAASAEASAEEAPAEAEAPADQSADLSAALPAIVVSMGANKENSYVTDYLEQGPYLVNIYEGYGFAKDYGSARGHEYTLEDVAKTQRPHPKANCLTCKTPDFHKLVEQEGVGVYSMPFDDVMAQMTTNVNCYTCHGDDAGNGGALVVTHQYVNEALGDNVSTIKPATLSCGQCHIEYYFTPADSETMMPYDSVEAMAPEAILAYYDAMDFADWTQESTGTQLLKAQHPEMETFLAGKHANFLTCADCHMPPEITDSGVAYHSHKLVSPLESEALLETCAACHRDTDMAEFVHGIQEKVTARETEVGNKLSAMKDKLAEAAQSGAWSEEDLNAVREKHRQAQWYFDFCYVENSEGAHNSELSMRCLDTSDALIDKALKLLNK